MKKELELEMYLQNNIQSEINHSIEIILAFANIM